MCFCVCALSADFDGTRKQPLASPIRESMSTEEDRRRPDIQAVGFGGRL